jgi:ribosomal protein S14
MLFKQVKDLKSRKIYQKFEKIRSIKKFVFFNLLSTLMKNQKLSKDRRRFMFLISKLKLKSLSKTKIVRRCILTNRSRRVIRPFHISHTVFRELNQYGLIPGCRKAVW